MEQIPNSAGRLNTTMRNEDFILLSGLCYLFFIVVWVEDSISIVVLVKDLISVVVFV